MLRIVDFSLSFWFAHDKFSFLGWMDKKAPTGPLASTSALFFQKMMDGDTALAEKEIRSLNSHWSWPDPKQTSRKNRLFLCSVFFRLSFEDPETHMGREHKAHLDNYEDGAILCLFKGETVGGGG